MKEFLKCFLIAITSWDSFVCISIFSSLAMCGYQSFASYSSPFLLCVVLVLSGRGSWRLQIVKEPDNVLREHVFDEGTIA